jgi:hypothetical protein
MHVPHLFVCTAPDASSDRHGHVVSVPLDGARASPPATLPSYVLSSDKIYQLSKQELYVAKCEDIFRTP